MTHAGARSNHHKSAIMLAASAWLALHSCWTHNLRDSSLHNESHVRAQLRLALDTGEKDCRPGALLWLFPAPPIRSGKADPAKAPAANFNKTNEPFWADEKTHAES